MFYTLKQNGVCDIDIAKWKRPETGIGYLTMAEAEKYQEKLKITISVLKEQLQRPIRFGMGLHIRADFSFAILYLLPIPEETEYGKLALFIRQDLFLLVELSGETNVGREAFQEIMKKTVKETSLEKIVYDFLDLFLQEGMIRLEQLQEYISRMEISLVEGEAEPDLNRQILRVKHHLSMEKSYFDQFVGIGAAFRENENRMFWQEDFEYFRLFTERAQRLSANAQVLCEDLIHVREALHAAMDYRLNSIMKVFTVVTTIFLPLSLITGWYGMNFADMPELRWKYGYPAVILLALTVAAGSLIYYKWKKLL